ncbi:hypothetical protein M422DRAFT_272909 [Sphaerobolus stellatus SS14]|uniref:Uncharacterized protein n=1 Tax=Sphaerobolus stellatus (strain SS14) TaxID=990650 RepID=A0A0C9UKQ4_SPHS4|nr:hypothetical protein M422DRAFT_272909 [Sphaerobolus stellatus SS14]
MADHEHDARAMTSTDLSEELGVQMNDQLSTHFRRALRSLNISVIFQKRMNIANDKELARRYQDLQKLEQQASTQTQKLKRAFTEGMDTEGSLKKLKSIEIQ